MQLTWICHQYIAIIINYSMIARAAGFPQIALTVDFQACQKDRLFPDC